MDSMLKQRLIAAGIAMAVPMVMSAEGLRQKVYIDPVGIPTVCFGHTGKDIQPGKQYALSACEDLLATDLLKARAAITQCVTVPLLERERAAYASFVYNVGGMAFCTSTLVRRLNAGDHAGACAQLDRWVYAKGIELPGLVKRRATERAMCEGRS